MTDTIERQAVIDLLKQMRKDGNMVPWEGKNVFDRIRKLPTAQIERTKGHWIKSDKGVFLCSVCHSGYKNQPTCMGKPMFEFCPICGADMSEGDAE